MASDAENVSFWWRHHDLPMLIWTTRESFKNSYDLINLGTLKSSLLNKLHIFHCMGKICCAEFQRVPLKFHSKLISYHTSKLFFSYNVKNLRALIFTSSYAGFNHHEQTHTRPHTHTRDYSDFEYRYNTVTVRLHGRRGVSDHRRSTVCSRLYRLTQKIKSLLLATCEGNRPMSRFPTRRSVILR